MSVVTIANITNAAVQFQVLQRGAWRNIAIPAKSSVTTEAERFDVKGQQLLDSKQIIIRTGAQTSAVPPVAPPAQFLNQADADRLYVRRAEFEAARATGLNNAVQNKTLLTAYKGSDIDTALSAQPTVGEGRMNQIMLTTIGGRASFWQIQPWNGESVEDVDAGLVFPNDFHQDNNPRVLVLIFSF